MTYSMDEQVRLVLADQHNEAACLSTLLHRKMDRDIDPQTQSYVCVREPYIRVHTWRSIVRIEDEHGAYLAFMRLQGKEWHIVAMKEA